MGNFLVRFIAFVVIFLGCYTTASSGVGKSTRSLPAISIDDGLKGRHLRAAQLTTAIGARRINSPLSDKVELHYLDESRDGAKSPFSARVRLSANEPTLVLEEIEHYMLDIFCRGSEIEIHFAESGALGHVHRELSNVGEFLLVTSHEGCNADGERTPYLVSSMTGYADKMLLVLSTTRKSWRNAFASLTVDFGGTTTGLEARRHGGLNRRQALATASITQAAASLFPTSIASAGPQSTVISKPFNQQFLNKAILPPDPALGEVLVQAVDLPKGLTISCKNCTVQGAIELSSGSFSMSSTNGNSSEMGDVEDFFESGYAELEVSSFLAFIDLETVWQPSGGASFNASLPAIPFTPFTIPGIATVGPELVPVFTVGASIQSVLNFSYGFQLTIPDNSFIRLDVGNLTNSTSQGFDKANITALPFQAEIDSLSLIVTAAFQPKFLLGISVLDNSGTAGFGAFLDLPRLTANISQVANVDSKCDPVNSTTANNIAQDIFGSLTNIGASVDVDLGLFVEADVHAGDFSTGEASSVTGFSTNFALPTACISFDSNAKTYGSAAVTTTTTGGNGAAGAATASSTKQGGGAPSMMNPLIELAKAFGKAQVSAGLVLAVDGLYDCEGVEYPQCEAGKQ